MAKKKLAPVKLDLACGQTPAEGFIGVDIWEGADVSLDLLQFPWPWADNSVDEINCSHFVEHIPMTTDENGKDMLIRFMEEVHRILKPGGTINIYHPHSHSDRAWWDPTHRRCIPFQTWYYFNQDWLTANNLTHYNVGANFDVIVINALGIDNDVANRSPEVQNRMVVREWNVVADTHVILQKI